MKNIVEYMAKSCVYAQEHFSGAHLSRSELGFALEVTSYQIACFLSQNTIAGPDGVDWDIVHAELCDGIKSEAEWIEIIGKLVAKLGGLKISEVSI